MSKQSGSRCKRSGAVGREKCSIHGGVSSAVNKAQRDVERKARAALQRLGQAQPVDNPLLELQRLAGEAKAWHEALREVVVDMETFRYRDRAGEQTRAEVQLYVTATRDLANILAQIGRLNIDERLAAVNEAHIQRLRAILITASRSLGIDVTDDRVQFAMEQAIAATAPKQLTGSLT